MKDLVSKDRHQDDVGHTRHTHHTQEHQQGPNRRRLIYELESFDNVIVLIEDAIGMEARR